MMARKHFFTLLFFITVVSILSSGGCNKDESQGNPIPQEILNIMNKPRYSEAEWSLRVLDLDTAELIYNLNPDLVLLTGSLRKTFSIGTALNELGPEHRFTTPVHRLGEVDGEGVLHGDLILVADGDLTLGGRMTPQGGIEFTNFDHVDANPVGSAVLTPQNPLTGLNELALQVAESGIKEVTGDVIIDDRLFDAFIVPNDERLISPMIINENLVDMTIIPADPGEPAMLDWRPKSAAFGVEADVITVPEGEKENITLFSFEPSCIGFEACIGRVQGQIPLGYKPDLPEVETLVQTFKIDKPSAYARTAFIEALKRAGVSVNTNLIGRNPSEKLPPADSYTADTLVAEFVSPPYSEYAKLVLKVSHNYGANLSLMLFGLAKGVRTVDGALEEERRTLIEDFGIDGGQFNFPTNGSGSPDSEASPKAVTDLLVGMSKLDVFEEYFDSFPILGVDGSLRFVNPDSHARGKVRAKTGTSVGFNPDTMELILRAKSLGGYIDSSSGKRLVFAVFVNNAKLDSVADVLEVNNDLGEIATFIYELN